MFMLFASLLKDSCESFDGIWWDMLFNLMVKTCFFSLLTAFPKEVHKCNWPIKPANSGQGII